MKKIENGKRADNGNRQIRFSSPAPAGGDIWGSLKTTGGIYPAGDNEPPIAPGNTRERLRIICGEKTQIAPRTGSTVATISIPKTENKQ